MNWGKRARVVGRRGGLAKSKEKARSSRANGQLGGRPRQFPRCPRYGPTGSIRGVSDPRADTVARIDLIVILEARGIFKAPCIVVQDRLTFEG